jgi:hypothetical protein
MIMNQQFYENNDNIKYSLKTVDMLTLERSSIIEDNRDRTRKLLRFEIWIFSFSFLLFMFLDLASFSESISFIHLVKIWFEHIEFDELLLNML